MTHLPFISQSCGDVLSETSHLTTEEFGAYQLLCFAFWQHGGLPDDDARLARIVRATPERWQAIKPTMLELFGADWWPERLAKRRDEVEKQHLRRSTNGKKGAQARWGRNGSANGPANSKANGPANGYANGNHNHIHNTLSYESSRDLQGVSVSKASKKIPVPHDRKEAEQWLLSQEVFPGDLDTLIDKMLRGDLTWREVEQSAA